MIWRRIMSWLRPKSADDAALKRLDALTAESVEQKERATRFAKTVRAASVADQSKAEATLGEIEQRIAAQERRLAERKSSPPINAALDALNLIQRHH